MQIHLYSPIAQFDFSDLKRSVVIVIRTCGLGTENVGWCFWSGGADLFPVQEVDRDRGTCIRVYNFYQNILKHGLTPAVTHTNYCNSVNECRYRMTYINIYIYIYV